MNKRYKDKIKDYGISAPWVGSSGRFPIGLGGRIPYLAKKFVGVGVHNSLIGRQKYQNTNVFLQVGNQLKLIKRIDNYKFVEFPRCC